MNLDFMSSPAQVAIAGYLLVCISVFFPMPVDDRDKKGKYSYRLKDRLVVLGLLLLPMALSVLTIHCMTVGDGEAICGPWSWVNAGLVFLWSIVIFAVAALGAFSNDVKTVERFKDKKHNLDKDEADIEASADTAASAPSNPNQTP